MAILSWLIHCECEEQVVPICSKILRHFMTLRSHIQCSLLGLNNSDYLAVDGFLSFPYMSCEAY